MSYELLRQFGEPYVGGSNFWLILAYLTPFLLMLIAALICLEDPIRIGRLMLGKKTKTALITTILGLAAGIMTFGVIQVYKTPEPKFPYNQIKADLQESYYVDDLYTAQDPSILLSSGDAKSEQRDIAKAVDGAVVEMKARHKDTLIPVGFTYDSETKKPKLVELAEKPTSRGISEIEK